MKVADASLRDLREQGFCVVEGFLGEDELAAARDCLWLQYPRPEDYFADPAAYPQLSAHAFGGLRVFPFAGWALNRLAFHPDLVDAVERYLGTDDLELYKSELWAKYAGAADYEQPPHRDFGNHSLVVPRADGYRAQITSFVLLSDVSALDAPTRIVPLAHTRHIPMVTEERHEDWAFSLPKGRFDAVEVAMTAPAGSLLLYRTDVYHRGSDFAAPGRSRFVLLADYQARGAAWTGKMAWPNQALNAGFVEVMERATPRERDLFGFPRPGDPYWNAQTLADVARRYPKLDMTPYTRSASGAR